MVYNETLLMQLWDKFLEDANEIGYVTEAYGKLNLKLNTNRFYEVAGNVTLHTPSDVELIERNFKSVETLRKSRQERMYNMSKTTSVIERDNGIIEGYGGHDGGGEGGKIEGWNGIEGWGDIDGGSSFVDLCGDGGSVI